MYSLNVGFLGEFENPAPVTASLHGPFGFQVASPNCRDQTQCDPILSSRSAAGWMSYRRVMSPNKG